MKSIYLILVLCFSSITFAGGWTVTAPVEHVEVIRGQGSKSKAALVTHLIAR
jgi:hypothetical protein